MEHPTLDTILKGTEDLRDAEFIRDDQPGYARMTTGVCLLTVMQLGNLLKDAAETFNQIPNCQPKFTDEHLKNLIGILVNAQKKAAKLLEANR